MGTGGRPRRVHCRMCERHVDECGPLSSRGKCSECGTEFSEATQRQLNAKAGRLYNDYRRKLCIRYNLLMPEDVYGRKD